MKGVFPMKRLACLSVTGVALCLSGLTFAQAAQSGTMATKIATNKTSTPQNRALSDQALKRITQEVRHQLVMLPLYSVFDNLAYQVSPDGSVTLMGQVLSPTLKGDAERAVKTIEGVERVINNIEVLPLSPNDDRIRRDVYRAIYSQPGLDMYSLRAVPTIHIIVKNGNVILAGAVGNQMDKQRAEIAAKGVPGVFSVTNNLQIG